MPKTTKEICENEVLYCDNDRIEYSGSPDDYNKRWWNEEELKEAIRKYELEWEHSNIDKHFNIEGLKEELGLS